MSSLNYLEWMSAETSTVWWHDSADPKEIAQAKAWGAVGVTTNPVLTFMSLRDNREYWSERAGAACASASAAERAESLMRAVVTNAASVFESVFQKTEHKSGYVCAQVNPALCANKDAMLSMAIRLHSWAPNVSVKLPATAAGLEVLEECAARGICVTSTVSFTVAQAVAAAEAYNRGMLRAERDRITPAPCFAVIMIGRVDDYMREIAADNRLEIEEADIRLAGLAITKRAYALFQSRGYRTQLLVAALRGTYHMEWLCGGKLVMSIHPAIQRKLIAPNVSRRLGIDAPVAEKAVSRLMRIPEFSKAYETDCLALTDFLAFGLTQKTLSQFSAAGWSPLETLMLATIPNRPERSGNRAAVRYPSN